MESVIPISKEMKRGSALSTENDSKFQLQKQQCNPPPPATLVAPISPPLLGRIRARKPPSQEKHNPPKRGDDETPTYLIPNLAAIEAGESQIHNHLSYFSQHLEAASRPLLSTSNPTPRLSIADFRELYRRNQHATGRHFVIHQHDHPVAGVHYDLRLQISESSSISFAIMYGLPGNVGSRRLSRNATETRVHNLWNHLIEAASHSTGSLLIWDTGEYSVLPYRQPTKETDDELSSDSDCDSFQSRPQISDSEKLHDAFQRGKIRLRLHGTRLPPGYTIGLRIDKSNSRYGHVQPKKPLRKRRRIAPRKPGPAKVETPPTSDAELDRIPRLDDTMPDLYTPPEADASALEREIAEQEDEEVRRTNAYPGAGNTINSIHQRTWYLYLDRHSSGFAARRDSTSKKVWKRRWEDGRLGGFDPFFVTGRDVETSVVTGRLADEVMHDEGVHRYVGRKGWRAVTE